MKLFVIGHIPAVPDTELVQDANASANCEFVPVHVTHQNSKVHRMQSTDQIIEQLQKNCIK